MSGLQQTTFWISGSVITKINWNYKRESKSFALKESDERVPTCADTQREMLLWGNKFKFIFNEDDTPTHMEDS